MRMHGFRYSHNVLSLSLCDVLVDLVGMCGMCVVVSICNFFACKNVCSWISQYFEYKLNLYEYYYYHRHRYLSIQFEPNFRWRMSFLIWIIVARSYVHAAKVMNGHFLPIWKENVFNHIAFMHRWCLSFAAIAHRFGWW